MNGVSFPKPFLAKLGETQIWTVTNNTVWSHPIHLHGFFLGARQERCAGASDGWKDTVTVPFKETVRFVVRFDERPGSWMFHCHVLDHAEGGLMSTVQLSATGQPQAEVGVMDHVHSAP
jgi:FtsP/CotA-like multicopper oxidase with cupredoxin domain